MFQVRKDLRMLSKIVNPIRIKNNNFVPSYVLHKQRKELMHVRITAKTRAYDPAMNGFFPGFYLLDPLLIYFREFCLCELLFLFRNKNWMNNDLGGIRFNGDCR